MLYSVSKKRLLQWRNLIYIEETLFTMKELHCLAFLFHLFNKNNNITNVLWKCWRLLKYIYLNFLIKGASLLLIYLLQDSFKPNNGSNLPGITIAERVPCKLGVLFYELYSMFRYFYLNMIKTFSHTKNV